MIISKGLKVGLVIPYPQVWYTWGFVDLCFKSLMVGTWEV